MNSIWLVGLISVLAGASLSQAQQITTVTATSAEVKPEVTNLPVSGNSVTDLHLRPLFTTTICLPEAVTSVAVGAPTLFEVEHSDQEPRLVFVKPTTKESATSNLVIALRSGQDISMRLLSGGDGGNTPVDFVVNYRPPQSFLIGSSDVVAHSVETAKDEKPRTIPLIDQVLKRQAEVGTPNWVGGLAKDDRNPDGKAVGKPLVAALGDVREKGEEMLVAYSVMNTTDHWIELLPPQVELNSPNLGGDKKKKNKKKREILAEQVAVTDYRLNVRRLAPGERADGAVQFARPGFKQSKDRLLLQLATASAVDTPLLMPVPFVAPGR
jgi:hypothetical protein